MQISNDLSSLSSPVSQPKLEGLQESSSFSKGMMVALLTPFYLATYAARTLVVTCLKVTSFIATQVMGLDEKSSINREIENGIRSIDRGMNFLFPEFASTGKSAGNTIVRRRSRALRCAQSFFRGVDQVWENISSPKFIMVALGIAVLYKTNAWQKTVTWLKNFQGTSKCVSYFGAPKNFEQAKAIFQCKTPFFTWGDATKGLDRINTTYESMSKLFCAEKAIDQTRCTILNSAHKILKEKWVEENTFYECLSKIALPRGKKDAENGVKILKCMNISPNFNCLALRKKMAAVLSKLDWFSHDIIDQVKLAYDSICPNEHIGNGWWGRRNILMLNSTK